jgi:hypothetical protein
LQFRQDCIETRDGLSRHSYIRAEPAGIVSFASTSLTLKPRMPACDGLRGQDAGGIIRAGCCERC